MPGPGNTQGRRQGKPSAAWRLKRRVTSALLVGETNHQHEGAYDMTHRKDDNAIESVLEVLIANGMEGMADAIDLSP